MLQWSGTRTLFGTQNPAQNTCYHYHYSDLAVYIENAFETVGLYTGLFILRDSSVQSQGNQVRFCAPIRFACQCDKVEHRLYKPNISC